MILKIEIKLDFLIFSFFKTKKINYSFFPYFLIIALRKISTPSFPKFAKEASNPKDCKTQIKFSEFKAYIIKIKNE